MDGKKSVVAAKTGEPKADLADLHDTRIPSQAGNPKDLRKEPYEFETLPDSLAKELKLEHGSRLAEGDKNNDALNSKDRRGEGMVRQNPDGTICEDCI